MRLRVGMTKQKFSTDTFYFSKRIPYSIDVSDKCTHDSIDKVDILAYFENNAATEV